MEAFLEGRRKHLAELQALRTWRAQIEAETKRIDEEANRLEAAGLAAASAWRAERFKRLGKGQAH